MIALMGAASFLIQYVSNYSNHSAYYIEDLENRIPLHMWLSLTRLVPGIMLLIISSFFDQSWAHMIDFLKPRTILVLTLHIFFTGIVVNVMQTRIEKGLDPYIQRVGTFFEPIPGCFYGYLLHEVIRSIIKARPTLLLRVDMYDMLDYIFNFDVEGQIGRGS